jgi:hypothetical protein
MGLSIVHRTPRSTLSSCAPSRVGLIPYPNPPVPDKTHDANLYLPHPPPSKLPFSFFSMRNRQSSRRTQASSRNTSSGTGKTLRVELYSRNTRTGSMGATLRFMIIGTGMDFFAENAVLVDRCNMTILSIFSPSSALGGQCASLGHFQMINFKSSSTR